MGVPARRARRRAPRELPAEGDAAPDLVIPGSGGAAGGRRRRRVRAARRAVLRADGRARPAGIVEGLRPRARRDARASPARAFARFEAGEHAPRPRWFDALGRPVVVKLDGLAAGKGVTVPRSDAETYAAIGVTDGPFVLEERMSGPECSLIVMCDGSRAVAFPLAQDHKRIGEGDTGPNTGGMGALRASADPVEPAELVATFVQPVLDHFAAAGTPYVGFLYAGLMLTADGPRLVEYNVRFGDPEAQVVLPLLDADLAALALAATAGALDSVLVRHEPGAACTVVAAAPGYPASPIARGTPCTLPQRGRAARRAACSPPGSPKDARAAGGCSRSPGSATTSGGPGRRLPRRWPRSSFAGMQYRRDIGWRAPGAALASYAAAGVDIAEGNRAVAQMKDAVERTHGAEVVRGVGSFGGAFSAKAIAAMDDPILVASTDGVGTKVELGAQLRRVRSLGHDIVNHCVGDVLVQSARPLFFLDYIASSTLDADLVAEMVTGMAEACAAAGCTLLGGETAEMPGVYTPGRSTSPARSSASPNGPSCSPAPTSWPATC